MKKQNNEVKRQKYESKRPALLVCLLILMIITGCTSQTQQTPSPQPASSPQPTATTGCTDKACFISAANDCKDISLELTEDAGTLKYSSSKDCVFTKTLVILNANETQEMKTLLQGKSLTCKYERGKFDQRLVTSLIFGTEYCEGELKDVLGQLIIFS